MLGLGARKFCAAADIEGNVGIGVSAAELRAFEAAAVVNSDRKDSHGGVGRRAGQDLSEVERKGVRVVHHRTEGRMDLALDERLQAGDERQVEPDGLQDKVERRRLHEREVDRLH